MIHNFVVLILGLLLGEIGMILVLYVLDKIRQLVKSAKGEQKMNEMSKSIAKVYLESLLSSYRASTVVEYDNSTYRMIWVSENDAKALEVAIKEMENGNNN